jgi:hypothetical protein
VTGLLRKPGGFEGLLSVTEILPVNKAAVAIRRDPRRRHIRLDTALPRSDVERADREHPVPEVADVGVVEPKNIEALRRIGEELLIPLTSSVGARYGRSQRLENYIRINQLLGERNIEVTLFEGPFEGVDPAPKYFYVLARHHLLPQPGGFEGALGAITAALPARPQGCLGLEAAGRTVTALEYERVHDRDPSGPRIVAQPQAKRGARVGIRVRDNFTLCRGSHGSGPASVVLRPGIDVRARRVDPLDISGVVKAIGLQPTLVSELTMRGAWPLATSRPSAVAPAPVLVVVG